MSNPLIVFATRYFQRPAPLEQVPQELRGHFSDDLSRLKDADAVVFHIPDFTHRRFGDMPKYRGQIWVAWSMESNVNYPLQSDPAFLRHFDLRITYERSADIWASYMPPLAEWHFVQRLAPAACQTAAATAAMFQSSLIDRSGRLEFASALMKHMRVDSYGTVLHNCEPDEADVGIPTKMRIMGRYRFCLAFENSISPDYVTEKLFQPLMAGTVPVYLGAPNAHEFAPAHSFVSADRHAGPEGLADYLHRLNQNPDEYEAYLAWRHKPLPLALSDLALRVQHRNIWRDLVEQVAGRKRSGSQSRSSQLPFGFAAALRTRWVKFTRG